MNRDYFAVKPPARETGFVIGLLQMSYTGECSYTLQGVSGEAVRRCRRMPVTLAAGGR
ncbi:MAG: hypothetical protein WA117_04750 [Verrucomicrobiia bacterium]